MVNLRGCAADGRRTLGLGDDAGPAQVVAAVDGCVRRWRAGEAVGVDSRDVPYLLGSLWGEAMAAAFGWAWVDVVFRRHVDTSALAVVSADRAVALFPIHHLLGLAGDVEAQPAVAAAFTEVAAGRPEGLTAGGYADLMDHVFPAAVGP